MPATELRQRKVQASSSPSPPSSQSNLPTQVNGRVLSSSCRILAYFAIFLSLGLIPVLGWFAHRYLYFPQVPIRIAVAAPSDNSITIWVRGLGFSSFRVFYHPEGHNAPQWQLSSSWSVLDASLESTGRVQLTKLSPATQYTFFVELSSDPNPSPAALSATERQELFEASLPSLRGSFSTFPSPSSDSPSKLTFAFGSCMGIIPFFPLSFFDWMRENLSPAFMLHLGDHIYSDFPFNIPFKQAYHQVLDDAPLSRFMAQVPMLITYDDHEIRNDWGSKDWHTQDHDLFKEAAKYFDIYVASRNYAPPSSAPPGSRYFNFSYGNLADFFVIDTRQFRSFTTDADVLGQKTMLGSQQKQILFEWLQNSRAPFKFIASSVVWSTNAHKRIDDGWAGYTAERNEIFDFIETHNITGVVLLSGDVHWAASFQIRPHLYEFSVSPLRTFPLPARAGEEKTLFMHDRSLHLGQITIEQPAVGEPVLNFTVYGWTFLWETPSPVYSISLRPSDLIPTSQHSE